MTSEIKIQETSYEPYTDLTQGLDDLNQGIPPSIVKQRITTDLLYSGNIQILYRALAAAERGQQIKEKS